MNNKFALVKHVYSQNDHMDWNNLQILASPFKCLNGFAKIVPSRKFYQNKDFNFVSTICNFLIKNLVWFPKAVLLYLEYG